MNIEKRFKELCEIPSDINEHLLTLKKYGEEVKHITEMGVRYGNSTVAFLSSKPEKMISYDLYENFNWRDLNLNNYEFKIGNSLEIEIELTELLFIDTLHNYNQLIQELNLHGNKSNKYIILHDTTSFEWFGESYEGKSEKGIWYAVEEWLNENKDWYVKERYFNNNGLTILQKNI